MVYGMLQMRSAMASLLRNRTILLGHLDGSRKWKSSASVDPHTQDGRLGDITIM